MSWFVQHINLKVESLLLALIFLISNLDLKATFEIASYGAVTITAIVRLIIALIEFKNRKNGYDRNKI